MCTRCGRPQLAKGTHCIHCLAEFQGVVEREKLTERDRVLEAYEPFLEADIGLGRRVLLSFKRLEWRPGEGRPPLLVDIADLKSVALSTRPVWESLYIGALACLAFVLKSPWFVHGIFALLALLAVAACALQKRYALRVKLKDGREAMLFLGVGARRSPAIQRIVSVWESLAPALESVGVQSGPASAPQPKQSPAPGVSSSAAPRERG